MTGMATTAEMPATAVRAPGDGWRMVVRGIGQLLITLGIVILLFVVYELWITGLYTRAEQHKLLTQLTRQWEGQNRGGVGEISTATPAQIKNIPIGSGLAVLRIPRFGKGYHMVIVQGTDTSALEKGPGHYTDYNSAMPGQVGNFAVAGHRTTYLHPFYNINELKSGDKIVLETKTMWFTYTVQDIPQTKGYPRVPYQEIVNPSDVAVAYPVPDQPDPNAKPTLKLLTFTSCNPRYSAAQRIVVHAILTQALHRGKGVVPPALVS
jgi:sortase A